MPQPLFLLDTDIVSLIGRQRPPPGLRSWLIRVGTERLAICFPVYTELLRGAHLLRHRDPERASAIIRWVAKIVATDFQTPAMSFEVADLYARMTSIPALKNMWTTDRSEKRNRLGHDLMIASLSIVHDAPVITANPKDYVRINEWVPLPGVYQPMQSRWYVKPCGYVNLPPFEELEPSVVPAPLPRIHEEEQHVSLQF